MAKTLIARLQAGAEEAYIHDKAYDYFGKTTIIPYVEVYRENLSSSGLTSKITCQFKADYINENGRIAKAYFIPDYRIIKIKDIESGKILAQSSKNDGYYGVMGGENKSQTYHFNAFDVSCNITHELLNGDKSFIVEVYTKLQIEHWSSETATQPNMVEYDVISTHTVVANMPRYTEILTATNFTDEENPVITYSLPFQPDSEVSRLVNIQGALSFDGITPDIAYRDIPIEAVNYTFQLTEAERNLLRNECANCNNKSIYYILKTTCENVASGETMDFYSQTEKTLSIVKATPSITATVEDINTKTLALTGDKNKIVKYYSNAQYEMIATASKGARITHQQITNGSQTATAETGVLNAVESNVFLFTCADSRDNIAYFTLTKELVNYIHLTCNLDVSAPDTDGKLNFTISGNFFNGSFGLTNNTLALQYRYKEDNGSYSNWITVNPTITNNTYKTSTITITGLNYLKTYTFQAQAIDKLETITSREYQAKTAPVFDWSNSDFNFNVPITYTENGKEYSISDAAKKLDNTYLDNNALQKMNGLIKAMSNRYELICEVGESIYYSDAQVTLYLYGNVVRGYLSATRKETIAAGNQANELVCQVEFDSGKKIIGFGQVAFTSGTEGGLANFQMTETLIYPDDGSISPESVGKGRFNIMLCSTGTGGDKFNAYFTFPCLLDLTKF